ncbi:MAG: hypothetical protein LBN10_00100 [Propionibacteriaceae bacterium]|nr:hypothetical protein [Propionibacteriaceae bacterium]
MVTKGRHPKNPINDALRALDSDKFEVNETHSGHQWGKVICRECGAAVSIWSTPKVPEDNARGIERFAVRHQHRDTDTQEGDA